MSKAVEAGYFVNENSVVREIWGKSDTILFIFAGAAAEFALNKAVDWLYFTGRLPVDPLGRLFSTVAYARTIIFADEKAALQAIDAIAAIHTGVEAKRGFKIPQWAYRDVLFLLVDYSVRAFEILERTLTNNEKQEVFNVFYRVGHRMGIDGLPATFANWEIMRQQHLSTNLEYSTYTANLFGKYRKHLGLVRYHIMLQTQALIVPPVVRNLLGLNKPIFIKPVVRLYKISRLIKADSILKELILPVTYKEEIKALDNKPAVKKGCPYTALKGRRSK